MTTKKTGFDSSRSQKFSIFSFFLKTSLEFYFHFLPKTSPGQFNFFLDFTSEIEKPLVDWLIIIFANLDQVPGCSLLDFVPEIKEPLVDWLRFFATPFLIKDRLKHRSSPVSFTVWSGTRIGSEGQQRQQHGIRAEGVRARQQQQRRRDANGADFATETEKGEFS